MQKHEKTIRLNKGIFNCDLCANVKHLKLHGV